MENNFQKYISSFNDLDSNDKKEEIIKHFKELLDYLKRINKIDSPLLENYENDDILTMSFAYLIVIKELSALAYEKTKYN